MLSGAGGCLYTVPRTSSCRPFRAERPAFWLSRKGTMQPQIQPVTTLKPIPAPRRASAVSKLTHLARLEAESIHIFREVTAEFSKPLLMYSIGKDSSVL